MESDIVYGLNPVLNALEGKRKPSLVYVSATLRNRDVERLCIEKGIKYRITDRNTLDRLTKGVNNQGVACVVPPFEYFTLRELFGTTADKDSSLILVLDGVEDPVNFGSLIRSASCFNCDGIIIGRDRQVQVTPTVVKLSTGASEYVPIVQVPNIAQSISDLKDNGYWIVSADGSGDRLYDEIDYHGKMAIIIGSEGRGVSNLVLKRSDFIARIPISGPITSLNAAIAGAIFLSAAASSRLK